MAAKVLIVKVTQEHIDKATREYPVSRNCPIARATGGCVGFNFATIGETEYLLSAKGKEFVMAHYRKLPLKPFTLRLTETKL